jgi:hypothetical protein
VPAVLHLKKVRKHKRVFEDGAWDDRSIADSSIKHLEFQFARISDVVHLWLMLKASNIRSYASRGVTNLSLNICEWDDDLETRHIICTCSPVVVLGGKLRQRRAEQREFGSLFGHPPL